MVDRADALATVFESNRMDVITDALREYLQAVMHDDEIKQEIAGAYYDDDLTFDQLTELLGHEEAANHRVLKTQLSEAFIDDAAEELADP